MICNILYMIFIIIGVFLILLVLYYYYNVNTKKESSVVLKDFIPSSKFNGYKKGYVFKNCLQGLGYYRDKYYE